MNLSKRLKPLLKLFPLNRGVGTRKEVKTNYAYPLRHNIRIGVKKSKRRRPT